MADVNNLVIKGVAPNRILFSKPHYIPEYNFDFQADFIINPDQAEGVKLVDGKVVITKVKPNVWFMRSNFGFTTDQERNNKFYNQPFKISGIQALVSSGEITEVSENSYYPQGLVVSPCSESGSFLSSEYPWEMGISDGYFKKGPIGALKYGYTQDGEALLYNYNVNTGNVPWWSGPFYEVGFAIWTAKTAGSDGYLQLSSQIVLEPKNTAAFDPTTVEGWEAYLGKNQVYQKSRTFQNLLVDYRLALLESGTYEEAIQGFQPTIVKSRYQNANGPSGDAIAYVVTAREYKGQYEQISIPGPTDLVELITKGYPIKFWAVQTEKAKDGLWASVIKAFKMAYVPDQNYLAHMFSKSNISSEHSDDGYIDFSFNVTGNVDIDTYINLMQTFDYSMVDKVRITVKSGSITSTVDMFRQTSKLKEVIFINDTGKNYSCSPSNMAGMFEYSALETYPKGLGITGRGNQYSEPACQISYAFHGAKFPTIGEPFLPVIDGELTPGDGGRAVIISHYYALSVPYCESAFDGWTGTELLWDLDMKFVDPASGANRVFMCPNLQKARIMGLNKGDWHLDGSIHGDLSGLDEESVNYLVSNLFDLTLNTTEADRIPSKLNVLSGWACTKGYVSYNYFEASNSGATLSNTGLPKGKMKVRISGSTGVSNINIKVLSISSMFEREINSGSSIELDIPGGDVGIEFYYSGSGTVTMYLEEPGKTELTPGLTAANLFLPNSLSSKISLESNSIAKQRGWTILFNQSLH